MPATIEAGGKSGSAAPSRLLPRARAAAWSPDGGQVLWLGEPIDEDGFTPLLLSGWPAVEPAITLATQVEPSGAAWVGDSGWVAFARDGALELVAAESGAAVPLAGTDEGARTPVWLPGRGLAYRAGETVRLRLCPMRGP